MESARSTLNHASTYFRNGDVDQATERMKLVYEKANDAFNIGKQLNHGDDTKLDSLILSTQCLLMAEFVINAAVVTDGRRMILPFHSCTDSVATSKRPSLT